MGCGGGHALDAYKRATLGRPDLIPGHQLGWPCIRLGNSHRHVVPRSTASMSETMPRRRQPAVMAAILHGHPDFTSKQVNPHLRRRPLLSYPAVLMSPPSPRLCSSCLAIAYLDGVETSGQIVVKSRSGKKKNPFWPRL